MDRTAEFKSCVTSIRARSAVPEHKQRLLNAGATRGAARSEFARMAATIGRDIQQTTVKLGKLAQLAKRKTIFDDRPVEISELTYIIKQDIAQLNQQIASLQAFVKQNSIQSGSSSGGGGKNNGKQVDEHNTNVVMMLQSKLADTSLGFKDVLEIRTQNMKATRDRTEQLQFSNSSTSMTTPSVLRSRTTSRGTTDSPLYASTRPSRTATPTSLAGGLTSTVTAREQFDSKGKSRALDNPAQADFLALDMGGGTTKGGSNGGQQGFMQMQMMEDNSQAYLQQRSTAIESIESTITELGSIFSQLATMVAQQGETVQRIDADTSDIANNVSGAQRELLKYYANMTGNRALMLKIFGIVIIFFLVSPFFYFIND